MRDTIRRVITWLFVGTVTMLLFGVGGEWIIKVADDKGWYRNAGVRFDASMASLAEGARVIAAFATSTPVLVALGIFGGLVAGMSLDAGLRRGPCKTKNDGFQGLSEFLDAVALFLVYQHILPSSLFKRLIRPLLTRADMRLSEWGLPPVPLANLGSKAEVARAIQYLRTVSSFLYSGDIDLARAIGALIVSRPPPSANERLLPLGIGSGTPP